MKFSNVQDLGRALMLPIALLPIAGILLRLGQPDVLDIKYIADAGGAIFANLSLLFALGVAAGLAKDNNGVAVLASCVGYFVMTAIYTAMDKSINTGVLGGILIGIIAAILYNKYKDIKLPDYLAFFGGKRFIPIVTGLVAVVVGLILGYIWPPIQLGINMCGAWLLSSGGIGVFLYGILNRFLLVTGLHHVLNNLVWFVFGDYVGTMGSVVHGDIARFMSGDKSAGRFMAGFFPIMMFGLPSACLAMYKNALSANKKAVAGLLLSMALTSFLTGVTEPIEFSFVFLAPMLFVLHSVLTGISLSVMYWFDVHLGFTFSAGFIDYLMFFKLSTNPLYLIPIGLTVGLIYYVIFDFFIRKYNLMTIGRDTNNEIVTTGGAEAIDNKVITRGASFIKALGGKTNLIAVEACTTRLRLQVRDSTCINKQQLQSLGMLGIVAPTADSLQVILGPAADLIASEIREILYKPVDNLTHNVVLQNDLEPQKNDIEKIFVELADTIISNLGGIINIHSLEPVSLNRLRISVKDMSKINADAFSQMSQLHLININDTVKHIYLGELAAEKVYAAIYR